MPTINILNEICNKIPNGLNELEIARFLYLETCKLFTFSTKFQNTDEDSFFKMYVAKVDASNLKTTEINCRMWSQVYSQLLNYFNIKNEIIDNGHQHVKIFIDKEEWLADATYGVYNDFARVKNNDMTCGFGYVSFQGSNKNIISTNQKYIDLLENIDKKLGYNNDKMEELRKFKDLLESIKNGTFDINKLSEEPITDKLTFKLEYLFSRLGKLTSGYYEAKDFVYKLEEYLLDRDEFSCVKAVELKRTNKDKSVDILQCIYIIGEDVKYYLLAPNLPIIRIHKEQLMNLAFRGYGIEEDKKIEGINYPKNFKAGEISKINKIKLYRDKIVGESEMLDEYTTVK